MAQQESCQYVNCLFKFSSWHFIQFLKNELNAPEVFKQLQSSHPISLSPNLHVRNFKSIGEWTISSKHQICSTQESSHHKIRSRTA